MECPECARLRIEREHRQRIYLYARIRMDAANTNADPERFNSLKKLADEANRVLEQVEAQVAQHVCGRA